MSFCEKSPSFPCKVAIGIQYISKRGGKTIYSGIEIEIEKCRLTHRHTVIE